MRRVFTRALALAALAGLAAASPPPAHASPPDVFGYGPRTQGMGNTGVAFASNYEAAFHNPAGLAAARHGGFTLGLQGGGFKLELDDERWPLDGYQGSTLGFHIPLPFGGVLEDTLVIAAAFYTPIATVLRTDIIFPEVPNFVLLARTQSVHVMLGLGINLDRLVEGLRIGVGATVLANIGGRLLVGLDAANQFTSQTETQLLAGFHPSVGLQYDATDELSFGLVYRSRVQSDIEIAIRAEDLLPDGLELPIITITATPQYDPHTLAFEAAWRPDEHWLFALQAQYRRWSAYEGVVGKTTAASNLPPHPNFRDTVTPRIAMEYTATRRRTTANLRVGYAFEPTPARPAREAPVRDSEGNPIMRGDGFRLRPLRYLDNHRHVLTGGIGIRWETSSGAAIEFDTFGQVHRLQTRTHDIGQDGSDTPMETGGWIVIGGWSVVFEW